MQIQTYTAAYQNTIYNKQIWYRKKQIYILTDTTHADIDIYTDADT